MEIRVSPLQFSTKKGWEMGCVLGLGAGRGLRDKPELPLSGGKWRDG